MFGKKKKKSGFEYCIENVSDMQVFTLQCKALEEGLTDLIKEDLIISHDNSPMQFYMYRDMEITVLYDIELSEIYINSPFDIKDFIINNK